MAIEIKSVQMPECCMYCPCSNDEGAEPWCQVTEKDIDPFVYVNKRPEWCPLAEVFLPNIVGLWNGVETPTNRQYLASLSNEELAKAVYEVILKIGMQYNPSIMGVADWLGRKYRKTDYMSIGEMVDYLNNITEVVNDGTYSGGEK